MVDREERDKNMPLSSKGKDLTGRMQTLSDDSTCAYCASNFSCSNVYDFCVCTDFLHDGSGDDGPGLYRVIAM